MQVLIADSGATKTDWAYVHNGKPVFIKTSGLHPAYTDQPSVLAELRKALHQTPDTILFYGAGCYSDKASRPVRQLLEQLFPSVPVWIYDDLTAVAHAFLNNDKGIVGILGTGSNSGLFDHGNKKKSVASLGYILGDEGSAADIGKRIIRSALRDEFSPQTRQFLHSVLGPLEYSDVIRQIYTAGRPSFHLAGITKKILQKECTDEILQLAERSIESFVDSHLKKYEMYRQVPLILTGGVAVHLSDLVSGILERNGFPEYRITGGTITALAMRQVDKMKS